MKAALSLLMRVGVFGLIFLFATTGETSPTNASEDGIVSRDANVDGVMLHYMTAGQGRR
jgi:hypothetical protein